MRISVEHWWASRAHCSSSSRRVGGDVRGLDQSGETQFQGRERLAGGVVKVPADVPPLIVLQAHELAGGPAEIGERLLALRADAAASGAVVTQQRGHHDEKQARCAGDHERGAAMIPPRRERGLSRLASENRHVVAVHELVAVEHVRAHGLPEAFHHARFRDASSRGGTARSPKRSSPARVAARHPSAATESTVPSPGDEPDRLSRRGRGERTDLRGSANSKSTPGPYGHRAPA